MSHNKLLKIVVATYGISGALVGLFYLLLAQEHIRKVLGASLLATAFSSTAPSPHFSSFFLGSRFVMKGA